MALLIERQDVTVNPEAIQRSFSAAVIQGHTRVVDLGDREGRTPVLWASRNGHEGVVDILLKSGASVHSKEWAHGRSSLFLPAINEHEAVVKLLFEAREVDVRLEDELGQAPFLPAAINGHDAVVETLLGSG
jgi:ankyrin repeat protein